MTENNVGYNAIEVKCCTPGCNNKAIKYPSDGRQVICKRCSRKTYDKKRNQEYHGEQSRIKAQLYEDFKPRPGKIKPERIYILHDPSGDFTGLDMSEDAYRGIHWLLSPGTVYKYRGEIYEV